MIGFANGAHSLHKNKVLMIRHISTFFLVFVLCFSSIHAQGAYQVETGQEAATGLLLDRAIASKLIAGGVVAIGNSEGILSVTARGNIDAAGSAPITEHTIFDVASLTKVVATTPSVMKLVDKKLVSLTDPISRWFPEFRKRRGAEITVINLLTHTSGLIDFNVIPGQSKKAIIRKAASQRKVQPGTRFNYADINFILLGELVHRVTGKNLDQYSREKLFAPLGARRTLFTPPAELVDTIAPTVGFTRGVVQDKNSRLLGGVTGHAGLFSSASDLAKFSRMMLGRGMIDGRRVLPARLVDQMTVPYYCSSKNVIRGLGWDMVSPFSAPKGFFFSEASFGHTGYSGSSLWIDPQQDLFVVVLTTRLDYDNTRTFNQFRRDISTFAAATFSAGNDAVMAAAAPRHLPPQPVRVAKASKRKHADMKLAALSLKKTGAKAYQDKKKKGKKPGRKQYSRTGTGKS